MAQEPLVKEQLTEAMRDAGAELVRQLDKRDFLVQAALWFYLADQSEWRLVIATPEVRIEGPKRLYKKLQTVLSKEQSPLQLSSLTLVDTQDPLIKLLSAAVGTGKGISGIRFSRNTINGRFIDDAYIYRIAA